MEHGGIQPLHLGRLQPKRPYGRISAMALCAMDGAGTKLALLWVAMI
jgi:hypothetical protein